MVVHRFLPPQFYSVKLLLWIQAESLNLQMSLTPVSLQKMWRWFTLSLAFQGLWQRLEDFMVPQSSLLFQNGEVKSLSRVRLFATPWTITYQVRPWDFPGKDTGVGCHFLLHQNVERTFNISLSRELWNLLRHVF